MKTWAIFLVLCAAVPATPGAAAEAQRLPLRLLYVGNNAARAADYAAFLEKHFAKVTVAKRDGFDPAKAQDADVVLLDWAQSETNVKEARSPLGKLENWSKPTVLLGSAGLLMAGQWQVIGGAG
jgi:hypothetical protein